MAENTGYLAYAKLKKVVDGGPNNGLPLDENNQLCSVTGLPQDEKDNDDLDPDYIPPVYDIVTCPLPDPITYTCIRAEVMSWPAGIPQLLVYFDYSPFTNITVTMVCTGMDSAHSESKVLTVTGGNSTASGPLSSSFISDENINVSIVGISPDNDGFNYYMSCND